MLLYSPSRNRCNHPGDSVKLTFSFHLICLFMYIHVYVRPLVLFFFCCSCTYLFWQLLFTLCYRTVSLSENQTSGEVIYKQGECSLLFFIEYEGHPDHNHYDFAILVWFFVDFLPLSSCHYHKIHANYARDCFVAVSDFTPSNYAHFLDS